MFMMCQNAFDPDPGHRRSSHVKTILPDGAVFSELWGQSPVEELREPEAAIVAHAAPRRRADFAAGRHCARRALTLLGYRDVSILSGSNREPLWPAGVVGSISHCDGYAVAVVARADDAVSIGVDAEPAENLPNGLLETISSESERHELDTLRREDESVPWDRLLFSIKESCYKAWYPIEQQWLGFGDVSIHIDRSAGTFEGRVSSGTSRTRFPETVHGRWATSSGLLVSLLVL
jgi:4'-phosphopantetheinyl transferase EntD